MITELVFAVAMAAQDGPLPGSDKVKHFFMSAFVQSVAFAVARAAGMDRGAAQTTAAISSMSAGIFKELNDVRVGRSISVPDLAWDAAGALAAAAILNGSVGTK